MSKEKDDIELLMARVEEMRTAQRDFFARKMNADKRIAIAREIELDALLRQLRKRYDPTRFKNRTEQKGLF
ncbi:MAG: hypothetical protein ABIT05_01270 [Chitinophagaceae bacterium]